MSELIDESARPEFWDIRYASGDTPWQLERTPAALAGFLAHATPAKVLIPGCGLGNDVAAFAQAGWEVTAIDFSATAVRAGRKRLGSLGARLLLGDFFAYNFVPASFDLIYERTFLCALPPARWPLYAQRVAQLLRPEGRLAGIFFYGAEADPPPHPLTAAMAAVLFDPKFTLLNDEAVGDSLPLFAGRERWQERLPHARSLK